MYDSLFPDEAQQVLNDRIRRPQPEPTPEVGAFSNFWTAVKGVVPATGLEVVRSANTILGQAAKAQAPADEAMLRYLNPSALEQAKTNADFDLDEQLRKGIKRFTPDPQTTGWAGQIVHGAGKVIGKALGYGAVGGMPGAVFGTGADEGINETLRLTDQGVDLGTAAKVGAIHGVSTAASVALPVAGKTVAQTAGLVAAGGPGAYMAETAAAKAILENADYDAISKQYDPFDPVGLVASTLLPAAVGVGAHVVRAKGAPKATVDEVAAAQSVIAANHVDSTSLAKAGDAAGMNAHVDALEAVVRQMEGDGPVQIPEGIDVATERIAAIEAKIENELTVYHGSPHEFDRFSLSHVGEGEGAQAYGWGMYFASKAEIADYYRQSLSKDIEEAGVKIDGALLDDSKMDALDSRQQAMATEFIDALSLGKSLEDAREQALHFISDIDTQKGIVGDSTLDRAFLDRLDEIPRGFLYKVAIPDGNYLDLDKRISEQGDQIINNLERLMLRTFHEDDSIHSITWDKVDGKDIYEVISKEVGGDKNASNLLKKFGIIGSKFLDASSRIEGEGTQNYVLFDEVARIVDRANNLDELRAKPEPSKTDAGAAKLDAEFPEIAAAKQIIDSGVDIPVKYTDEMGNEIQVSARDLLMQADDAVKLAESDSKAFDAAITCFLGG